jgi:hypothetical protein
MGGGMSSQLEAMRELHWKQFGGRKQRSAVDAVAYVMNRTHNARNKGHIEGLSLMDFKGTFDHVNHRQLLTTMVATKLDGEGVAIENGITALLRCRQPFNHVTVHSDSTAAITRVQHNKRGPGQSRAVKVIRDFQRLRTQ